MRSTVESEWRDRLATAAVDLLDRRTDVRFFRPAVDSLCITGYIPLTL